MAISTFKGVIGTGTIEAVFRADSSNADSDILIADYSAVGGGQAGVDRDVTAPGGTARVKVSAPSDGYLEIMVSIGTESDSGELSVLCNGSEEDTDTVTGSVRWVYSVQEGA